MFHLLRKKYAALSLDGLSHFYFKWFLNKAKKSGVSFLQTVGHPKKLSKEFLKNLEYLLKNYDTLSLNDLKEYINNREKE